MRKFFGQKSKHKTVHQHQTLSTTLSPLTGSSVSTNKDDETEITKIGKSQTTSSHSQTVTSTNPSTDILIKSTSNESLSSEVKQEENIEKSKKLFVVVSGKYF